MLPDTMELQSPQTKVWPPIPPDVYQTEITNIEYKVEKNIYKEREPDPAKKASMSDEKQFINFEFTIIEIGPHYGRKVWQKMSPVKPYPPSNNGKETWVYRLACAMEGHPMTRDEADRYAASNINGYIHGQLRVTVKNVLSKDGSKTYNNVESFLPIKSSLPLFDENRVPKENQPEAKTQSGYDKFKSAAENLPKGEINTDDEVKVDDIPF